MEQRRIFVLQEQNKIAEMVPVQGRSLAPDMLTEIQWWTQPIILLTHRECSTTDLY